MAKPSKHLSRMVEREENLECLDASVERPALKKHRDFNVKVGFRGFLLVFVFSWNFLSPTELKFCETQSACRYCDGRRPKR